MDAACACEIPFRTIIPQRNTTPPDDVGKTGDEGSEPRGTRNVARDLARLREAVGDGKLTYLGFSYGTSLGATYADSTIKALGVRYRSNALAQEKTGEAWVQGKMMGSGVHGDFEHAEVAVFIGKNPWQSHGFGRTRVPFHQIERKR